MPDLNIAVSDLITNQDGLINSYDIDSLCYDSVGVNGAIVQLIDIDESGAQKVISNILFPKLFNKVPIKRIFERPVLTILAVIPKKRIFRVQKI